MDTDVAIVGAGPYGLSTAAHLAARGVKARTFGPPMDTWLHHVPVDMLLKSDGFATNLCAPFGGWTLAEYCQREGLPYSERNWPRVQLERFTEYAMAFQRELVADLDRRMVAHVGLVPGGFSLTLSDDHVLTARRVVLAVGITHFAYIPPELRGLGERVTHSGAHSMFGGFAGKRVAVIGAGASAVEVAAGLVDVGADVHLLARRAEIPFWSAPDPDAPGPRWWQRIRRPSSGMGPGMGNWLCQTFPDWFRRLPPEYRLRIVREHLGPASGWWLRDKVLGEADVRTLTAVRSARAGNDTVVLTTADRSEKAAELEVDHVICGTGYSVDIDQLSFLDTAVRGAIKRVGAGPALSRNFESSVSGLHIIGLAAAGTFGPLMRFVVGAEFAVPRVAAHLASPSGAGA